MASVVRFDCKFYLGDRPCRFRRECDGCERYTPMGTRILVVKLAAAGDVLRTTAILPPLKRKYPESHVTWVTDEAALPFVLGNPHVDRALTFDFETSLTLGAEEFDVVLSLDKEARATALVAAMSAGTKLGFGHSKWGTTEPLNEGAWYDLELGLSDEKKFRQNELTHAQIICATAELEYGGDPYTLALPDSSIEYARRFVAGLSPAEPLVGLNAGAGRVFANKVWTATGYAALSSLVSERLGGTALVLGGADDRERVDAIIGTAGAGAVDGGTHDLLDFAAIVGTLDALVTGDTMALHIAVALGVPVVAIFGPTVPQEIELQGGGRKVASPIECAPCYLRSCDRTPSCMDMVGVEEVFSALVDALEAK